MRKVRLIDLGVVPYMSTQSVWHAVAYAMEAGSPDTITLLSPDRPYICIGYHQELEKEVDLDFCQREGLPVTRREVGGGTVYLDSNQVFTHFIFHRRRVPRSVEEVYQLFCRPTVEAYQALGVAAYHRPVNDIQVAGRKIGGTGAALIGEAMVMAGSLMFDFNTQMMARAIKVSSEKMRDKILENLQDYMTTLRRELGAAPDREMVKGLFIRKCEEVLGVEVVPGELTPKELTLAQELDRRLGSWEFLNEKSGMPRRGVKIKEGLRVLEGAYKAAGGLIRATTVLEEEIRIDDLTISGDFTIVPSQEITRLERTLEGEVFQADPLLERVNYFYRVSQAQSPGIAPDDWVRAILIGAEAASN